MRSKNMKDKQEQQNKLVRRDNVQGSKAAIRHQLVELTMTLTLSDAPHGPNLVGASEKIHGTGTNIIIIFIVMTYFIKMPS